MQTALDKRCDIGCCAAGRACPALSLPCSCLPEGEVSAASRAPLAAKAEHLMTCRQHRQHVSLGV